MTALHTLERRIAVLERELRMHAGNVRGGAYNISASHRDVKMNSLQLGGNLVLGQEDAPPTARLAIKGVGTALSLGDGTLYYDNTADKVGFRKNGHTWTFLLDEAGTGTYDVTSYGADPIGLVDSTDAIEAAIAAIAASSSFGILYFPPGTYLISSVITIDTHMLVMGAGAEVSILKFSASFTGADTGSASTASGLMMFFVTEDFVTFRDLSFDGIDAPTSLPVASGTPMRVFIHYYGNSGSQAWYGTVIDCYFHDLEWEATGAVVGCVAFSDGAYHAQFLHNRGLNVPGGVFFQGFRSVAAFNHFINYNDSCIAATSAGSSGTVIFGNMLFQNSSVTGGAVGNRAAIAIEEGVDDFIVASNTIRGLESTTGIWCRNFDGTIQSHGGLIYGNLIDGDGLDSGANSAMLFRADGYWTVDVINNRMRNAPITSNNDMAVLLAADGQRFIGNKVSIDTASTGLTHVVAIFPGITNAGLIFEDNDIDGSGELDSGDFGVYAQAGTFDWGPGAAVDYDGAELEFFNNRIRNVTVGLYTESVTDGAVCTFGLNRFYNCTTDITKNSGDLTYEYVLTRDVQLTNAQMLALRGTPVTLVAAPGANKAIIVSRVHMVADLTAAYTVGAGDDIAVEYADGLDILTVETTAFIDGTGVRPRYKTPASNSLNTPTANSAVRLFNNGGSEFGGGNSANTFSVRIWYSIVPTVAFT